jgi:hypothetical protein
MQSLRSTAVWIARWASAIMLALAAAPIAWAEAPTVPEPQPTGPDYVKSYMLTILVCILGIMVVCRSAHRTTEVKFFDED